MADLKDEELKILKQGREKFSGDNPGPQNVPCQAPNGRNFDQSRAPQIVKRCIHS